MKKKTCGLIVGTIMTGFVVFLLGFDIASKRKRSNLVTKDTKPPSRLSDMQILNLIDKRIEKLENTLYDFIQKTSEASKLKKTINVRDDKNKLPENRINKQNDFVSPFKFQINKNGPMISEMSSTPKNSSYEKKDKENLSEETPTYLKGLINSFHLDKLNWPLINENNKVEPENISKRELVNLAPKDLQDKSLYKEKKNINHEMGPFKVENQPTTLKNKKPKSLNFFKKSLDDAVTPIDNIPNLTDFSKTTNSNSRPIFFTENNKIKKESKSLPLAPFTSVPSIERIESKKEDSKKLTEAIDKIFKDGKENEIKFEDSLLKAEKEDLSKSKEDLSKSKEDLSKSKEDLSKLKEDLSKSKEDLSKSKDFPIFDPESTSSKSASIKKSNKKKHSKITKHKKNSAKPRLLKIQDKDEKEKRDLSEKSLEEKQIKDIYDKEYYVLPKSEQLVKEPESNEFKLIKSTIDSLRNSEVENAETKDDNLTSDNKEEGPVEVKIKL